MNSVKKGFDSVKAMRDIRDKLSKRFRGMGFDEQKRYISERVKGSAKGGPQDSR